MKYYITGDCHRHFERISFFCRYHATTKEDVMILLGDAGVNFFMDETDRALKCMLSDYEYSKKGTILWKDLRCTRKQF